MSQSNEGNDQNPDGSDEFDFYFRFTKPLVIYLPTEEDRSIAAAWVEKLEAEPENEQEKRLRLDYLKLLLFVLQRGRLSGIFRKQPPSGPLQPFPMGFNVSDMGNLMIDQDDIQGCGGGDARTVPYTVEISNDLREFVAAQEIPNFGVQMYYAWSSDDPIHKWSLFDEEKFPQYVLDKIKLLKEIKSDEKTGVSTKGCGAKKVCDIPLVEKYTKTKVKSPQEIEKAQGRSYQTYLGLVGQMGRGFKDVCDDDPEKYNKQDSRRGKCQKKAQKKCGLGQTVYSGDLAQGNEEYDNFLSGLSGNSGNGRSQNCPCPSRTHSPGCESQMKQQYDNQQAGNRSCSPKIRSEMPEAATWETPVARGAGRKMQMNYSGGQCPDQAAEEMDSCAPPRRSMSPSNRNCWPARAEPTPPQHNCKISNRNGNMANSSQSCACPCPRDENESPSRMSGPSSASGRERCRPQPQSMKIWTTPNDASFQGLEGLKRAGNDEADCYDEEDQASSMNMQQQRGQEENWCCNVNDVNDSRMNERKGKQTVQDRRDGMAVSSRPYKTASSTCPPRQAPSGGYSSCSPSMSPQMQRKNKMQDPQDMCGRNGRMQQQDYCSEADNMQGSYGMVASPNFPQGQSGGPMMNKAYRSQGPTMPSVKSMNFDYQSDFDDGYNNQPMNRSNRGNIDTCAPRNDPCAQRNDPCAKRNDPCAQRNDPCAQRNDPCAQRNDPCAQREDPCTKMNESAQRVMPSRSKMQTPMGGPPCGQNTSNGRLYDMNGFLEGIKQKTEAHREKCDPSGGRKSMANDGNVYGRNGQPRQQPSFPSPQQALQSQGFPSQMKSPSALGADGMMGGSPYSDAKYGRGMNMSRKSPSPKYESYNAQKGMQNMNSMAPCPPSQGQGSFRGPPNYSQGMNRSNMQNVECPELGTEEEDDDCVVSSADERPQGSSTSVECCEGGEEDAEVMDDNQCPAWPMDQEPQARARGFMSMQRQKTKEFLQMIPPDTNKRKGRIVSSTPKKSPFSPTYGDSINQQIEQTFQHYYPLPDKNDTSYTQVEDNFGYQRQPCDPSQQNEKNFSVPEQSRSTRTRAKEQRRRGVASVCDDNAQLDPCNQSCGY